MAEYLKAKAKADAALHSATDAWISADRADARGDMAGYRHFRRIALRRDRSAERLWAKASAAFAALP